MLSYIPGARLAIGGAVLRGGVRGGVARGGAVGRGAGAVAAGRVGARTPLGRRGAGLRARAPALARLPGAVAGTRGTQLRKSNIVPKHCRRSGTPKRSSQALHGYRPRSLEQELLRHMFRSNTRINYWIQVRRLCIWPIDRLMMPDNRQN